MDIPSYALITKYINQALENKYERFLFFVNSNDIVDYSMVINDILDDNPSLDVTVIKINALSYPLAHLVIESEKLLKANDSIDDVISFVNLYRDNFKIYFYSPKENILPSVKRIDLDDDLIASTTSGKLYEYDGNRLIDLKKDVKESQMEKMLDLYLKDVENSKVIPFLVFTNKYSSYNDVLERKLLTIYPRLKNIKMLQIPIVIGSKIGNNAVGIGYIKKIDEKEV